MTRFGLGAGADDPAGGLQRILRLTGRDRRVLELGCGIGVTTLFLKERGCFVVGVEPDPDAAAQAEVVADRVIVADPGADDWLAELGGERFDVVVADDVLGAVVDPGALLARLSGVLERGGHVVAAVPNVAHGSVRLALEQGHFPDAPSGGSGRSPLRFFTPTSLLALLESSGWVADRVEEVRLDPLDGGVELDPSRLDPDLVARIDADPAAHVFEVVLAARPAGDWPALELEPEPALAAVAVRAADRLPEAAGGTIDGVRAFAFYLPQFHPIPENDAWWGRGFTEWTNVAKAGPRFRGHRQPNLPADLGFYDLRVAETRHAQAALAAAHGIEGFVYYHYWFGSRRLLEGPLESVLASGEPDYPFALLWANESWSRQWDGRDLELLVEQTYPDGDVERHATYLAEVFADPRYVHVDGAPLFAIYRIDNLPGEPRRYVESLRAALARAGVPRVHLVRCETGPAAGEPSALGFDAELEFHPHRLHDLADPLPDPGGRYRGGRAFDYAELAAGHLDRPPAAWTRYPCVVPHWDNSPRRSPDRATLLVGSTPELYERWLRGVAERAAAPGGPGLVFLNAWNEWAEGAYLEPDQRDGTAYLEATRRVLGERPPVRAGAGSAAWIAGDLAGRLEALQREVSDAYERGEAAVRAELEAVRRELVAVIEESEARRLVIAEVTAWAKDQEAARHAAEGHYHALEAAYQELEAAYRALQGRMG